MRKNRNLDYAVIDQEMGNSAIEKAKEFRQEIEDNNELIWLEDLRWYRSKLDVGKPPKSSILRLLF